MLKVKMTRICRLLFITGLFILVTIALYYYYHLHTVQTVIADEIYRSAQLDKDEIEDNVQMLSIRSIINLRGKNSKKQWYKDEVEISSSLDVSHYDIRLSSYGLPRRRSAIKLMELLSTAERPVLVHCNGGADRAGLASVMALLLSENSNIEQAAQHVSLKYFAIKSGSTGKIFFTQYKNWLDQNNLAHSSTQFIDWLKHYYVDDQGNFRYYIGSINNEIWKKGTRYIDGYTYTISRDKNDYLDIKGWAFDAIKGQPVKKLGLLLNSQITSNAKYGLSTPGIASYYNRPGAINSGWSMRKSLSTLKDGCYRLTLKLERMDGSQWQSPPQARICVN